MAIDTANGTAIIVGNDGVDGFVFVLNLTSLEVTDTLTIDDASGLARVVVDVEAGLVLAIDPTNDVAHSVQISTTLSLVNSNDILTPVDVAMGASTGYAIITHDDESIPVSLFSTSDNSAIAIATVVGEEGQSHLSSSFADVVSGDEFDVAVVVTMLSDEIEYIVVYDVSPGSSISENSIVDIDGVTPGGIALLSSGEEVLISDPANDQVLRIDLSTEESTAIDVGDGPTSIVINDADGLAYVINANARTVSIIDLSDYSVTTASVERGLSPNQIATDRATSGADILVPNTGDGTVNVFTE